MHTKFNCRITLCRWRTTQLQVSLFLKRRHKYISAHSTSDYNRKNKSSVWSGQEDMERTRWSGTDVWKTCKADTKVAEGSSEFKIMPNC